MSGTERRVDLKLGDFACSVHGFDDPVRPLRSVLRAVQRMIEETPEIAETSLEFSPGLIDGLLERLERDTDIPTEELDIQPGLIVVHRGQEDPKPRDAAEPSPRFSLVDREPEATLTPPDAGAPSDDIAEGLSAMAEVEVQTSDLLATDDADATDSPEGDMSVTGGVLGAAAAGAAATGMTDENRSQGPLGDSMPAELPVDSSWVEPASEADPDAQNGSSDWLGSPEQTGSAEPLETVESPDGAAPIDPIETGQEGAAPTAQGTDDGQGSGEGDRVSEHGDDTAEPLTLTEETPTDRTADPEPDDAMREEAEGASLGADDTDPPIFYPPGASPDAAAADLAGDTERQTATAEPTEAGAPDPWELGATPSAQGTDTADPDTAEESFPQSKAMDSDRPAEADATSEADPAPAPLRTPFGRGALDDDDEFVAEDLMIDERSLGADAATPMGFASTNEAGEVVSLSATASSVPDLEAADIAEEEALDLGAAMAETTESAGPEHSVDASEAAEAENQAATEPTEDDTPPPQPVVEESSVASPATPPRGPRGRRAVNIFANPAARAALEEAPTRETATAAAEALDEPFPAVAAPEEEDETDHRQRLFRVVSGANDPAAAAEQAEPDDAEPPAAEPAQPATVSRFEQLLNRYGGPDTPQDDEDKDDGLADAEEEPTITAHQLATAAGATTVPDLLTSSAAWLTLVKGQSRFTRRDVMTVFEDIPGPHAKTLEARIKGYGKLVRGGQLVLVDDGLFALGPEERERYDSLYP
ncbi:MAG: hypothetical protein AAF713_06400 [Pseudomonadota bacterium]